MTSSLNAYVTHPVRDGDDIIIERVTQAVWDGGDI